MTFKHRINFIRQFIVVLSVFSLFLGLLPLAMGEDPVTISDLGLEVNLGTIKQLEVTIGEPVVMYQELSVKNTKNRTINASIDLFDYPDMIPEVYLNEYLSLSITSEGKLQSVQTSLPVVLAPYQTKDYILEYEFVPVYKDVDCIETTIEDYLPSDAIILPSTLPPETVIEKKCNVKIHHDGEIHYYNVEVTLEEFDGEKINSIYYVEGESYVRLKDGVISLAK